MEACEKAGYTYEKTWQELTIEEQARHIAKYLLDGYINSHQQDAQAKESKRKKKNA